MERIRLDFDFHLTLVSLSGNQVFTDIQEQLTKKDDSSRFSGTPKTVLLSAILQDIWIFFRH